MLYVFAALSFSTFTFWSAIMSTFFIINIIHLKYNDELTLILDKVENKLATSSNTLNTHLSSAFKENFPTDTTIIEKIPYTDLFSKHLDNAFTLDMFDQNKDALSSAKKEERMRLVDSQSQEEICNYLLKNIPLAELISNAFFCDFIHKGKVKIQYQSA